MLRPPPPPTLPNAILQTGPLHTLKTRVQRHPRILIHFPKSLTIKLQHQWCYYFRPGSTCHEQNSSLWPFNYREIQGSKSAQVTHYNYKINFAGRKGYPTRSQAHAISQFHFWVKVKLKGVFIGYCGSHIHRTTEMHTGFLLNPLNPELNPICYLLALLGAHHFLHASRIRVKSLTLSVLMSYVYGAPILDISRSHTTTQHSR